MQKIVPSLWFDNQAEEAANFYVSIFSPRNDNSRVLEISRYGKSGSEIAGRPEGTVMTVEFELAGQKFLGLNGGPIFTFSHAISFVVHCESEEEVDHFWDKLGQGGSYEPCGWLRDKYGVSWQVVPTILPQLLTDPDPAKRERVMKAMLEMKKLEIQKLKDAAEQK